MGVLGFMDKIGLIQIDESAKEVVETKTVENNKQSVLTPKNDYITYSQSAGTNIDSEMVNGLKDLIYNSDPTLVDFLKLKSTMSTVIPDKSTMISAVIAAFSAKGISKEMLKKSFEDAKNKLIEQKGGFDSSVEKTKTEKLGLMVSQIELAQSQILDATKKISELQEKITTIDANKKSVESEIQSKVIKFNDSYNLVFNELNEEINKI